MIESSMVTADCTISSFESAPGSITINAGVTLTVTPTGILELDLTTKHLLVKDTAKVIVKQGGAIAQTGTFTPPPGGEPGGSTLVFHHPDHLSSAGVDTDESGVIVQLTDHYLYGDSRIEEVTGAFHNDYTYTGKERDEDTELLYYEARYYDSTLGRFLSLDPWGGDIKDPQSFNKYAYVRNNPLKYVDPDGQFWALAARMVLSVAAGVISGAQNTGYSPKSFTQIAYETYDAVSTVLSGGLKKLGTKAVGGLGSNIKKVVSPKLSDSLSKLKSVLRNATGAVRDRLQSQWDKLLKKSTTTPSNAAPDFIGTSGGTVYPVPDGAVGPVPVTNKSGQVTGHAYVGGQGGKNGQVENMRIMDPTEARGNSPGYPDGYIKYEIIGGRV